ncbi:DUF5319 domain-containing protein [Spirillospora sp. CA-142024]|uniref:DUF5319 domain-containing protein n=1 Tax=unclassified Spirillospora TaxID=2642701 RepID=UPI003D8DB9B4
MHDDAPLDPFAGDPEDPAAALGDPDDTAPLSVTEREDVLADLADLEVFRALLEPLGVRGLTVDCGDCGKLHYIDWDLLHGNLRHLLDQGLPRVHEPALSPDPVDYVSWEYARGYVDGVIDSEEGRDEN